MEELKKSFGEIFREQKGVLSSMAILLILSLALLVFSVVTLSPGASVVKVGYGDIGRYQGGEWSSMTNSGGYQDGSWMEMLAFPVLALVFGLLHNVLIVKVYGKRGSGMAILLAIISIMLVIGAFLVLVRLLGEG
ncbi:hypothetical protein IKG16_02465 [Candidatus Saccharibacteria bacterium]|nr:hypothetical protein [Candidatus Saccharibacteria bacterium]